MAISRKDSTRFALRRALLIKLHRRDEESALGDLLASADTPLGTPTDIFFVTHFPRHLRPYNVHPSNDGEGRTNSFDIIMRGQEISTGYQCLHSHEELRTAMKTRKCPIDPESEQWRPFAAAYETGMPPLGGVGSEFLSHTICLPEP
jgi:aspartyl-tRNA synthetase